MNNQDLVKKIVQKLGGKENILAASNCMTRLRVDLKDDSIVNIKDLKAVEGVMGVVEDETLQIVVGPGKAKKCLDILKSDYNISSDLEVGDDWEKNKAAVKSGQKQSKLKRGLKTIGKIFIPLIPAIIAAGIFNGFAGLITNLQNTGSLPTTDFWNFTQLLLSLLGGSFLGYLAIFTGINAAKQFGATEGLGGMLGALTIMSQITEISQIFGMYDAEVPLNSILTTGKGGIIGVIIGVYILSIIEKKIRKSIPDVLDLIVTPVVTMLIMALGMIFVIMPLSGVLSDWLVGALTLLVASENPIISVISGYVLAAVFLPMVLLGLHHGLIPLYAIQLENMGGVSLFPVLAMAGAGQVGAAIAIYLKAKKTNNMKLKQIISGALPAGILGIGEPLIYGVTLPLGKPFITAGLGAGFGGAFVMLQNVMAGAWGPSGITAIPLMQPGSMLSYFIGLVIAYIGGFVVTHFFIKDEEVAQLQ
ncbi:PTS system IIB component (Glc family) /PTS system IIC component (Glc family) [Halanaerobium saccharolyticum]|uniref:PTS system IIB component (Glc family) /PTS system IIC component (Glc family) n=1 Tax=Halanaerobium saccharolyticum TaxID=43595 RepID=A0A4R7Z2W3_9FIRM|nr:PTS transporter subunit EIIC [Halanaerobium saccharolyticum]RAK07868.1 PTS system IIB component (Glc family) /PTS system IIC component (Glc family) [Halanaerobium saccharolyticum]TDW04482.1 PTS system IIB component (Glc family) /PTS system IIC component (Glc family) [Halanaerobium saccharolyticum]TDX59818.1 PTS system IIB component (Glc family) /PTS system IIC component (Glc family) [Halanaerobium saccharolyticum]